MSQTTRSKRSPLMVIVIILAVIVAILFVTAGSRISVIARGPVVDYDARDYIYSAESDRYGQLYDTAIRDMYKRTAYSTEVAECRALAFYYEQAVLEHAYRVAGDDAKAAAVAERMEEYEAELGSMAKKAESVRNAVDK